MLLLEMLGLGLGLGYHVCLGLCERIEYKLLFLSLIKFLLPLSLPLHVAISNMLSKFHDYVRGNVI